MKDISLARAGKVVCSILIILSTGYPLYAVDHVEGADSAQARRQGRHNQKKFSQAFRLIENGQYENALVFLRQNIEETPNAVDIDLDYGWATVCLAKLCRGEEFVGFYEIMRSRYYGASRIHAGGSVRDWEDKLMEAKKALFECPNVNSQAMVSRLMPIDDKAERTSKSHLEELIHLGSMGDHRAIEELQFSGAALVEYIAKGDLILAKDAALLDTNFVPGSQTVPSIRKLGNRTSVYLPQAMLTAINNFDSTFACCTMTAYPTMLKEWYPYSENNLPFVVLGDFNGDSIKDAALQGHTKSQGMIICVVSTGSGYQVLPVDSGNGCGDNGEQEIYLTHVGPGLIKTGYETYSVQLTTDAFNICFFEKASTMYYYKDGKFLQYATSD